MRAKRLIGIVALFAALAAMPAAAQQTRIVRGTIVSVDGGIFSLKPSQGANVTVRLSDNAKIFGVETATLASIGPGDFIGVGAMPQPDGSQKAIQVTIFAETQRGTGEGFRPWDRPGSTMTNGTVAAVVTGVSAQVLTVKYKGGEQKIVVAADAKIRRYIVGSAAEFKPGIHVALYNPQTTADGSLQTGRINFGIGDLVP